MRAALPWDGDGDRRFRRRRTGPHPDLATCEAKAVLKETRKNVSKSFFYFVTSDLLLCNPGLFPSILFVDDSPCPPPPPRPLWCDFWDPPREKGAAAAADLPPAAANAAQARLSPLNLCKFLLLCEKVFAFWYKKIIPGRFFVLSGGRRSFRGAVVVVAAAGAAPHEAEDDNSAAAAAPTATPAGLAVDSAAATGDAVALLRVAPAKDHLRSRTLN